MISFVDLQAFVSLCRISIRMWGSLWSLQLESTALEFHEGPVYPLVGKFSGNSEKNKSFGSYLTSFWNPANVALVRNKKVIFGGRH